MWVIDGKEEQEVKRMIRKSVKRKTFRRMRCQGSGVCYRGQAREREENERQADWLARF